MGKKGIRDTEGREGAKERGKARDMDRKGGRYDRLGRTYMTDRGDME